MALQISPKTRFLVEHQMMLIRTLEDKLQILCDTGVLPVDLHFGRGQEAIATGVCASLKEQDILLCHHRMIPWAVSRGVPLRTLVAELFGKANGICGGRSGEMHMAAMQYGLAHTFQLVGTVVPVAAGVAWALKNYRRNDGIAVAVFGDAATANGQFHEGLNIAAVQQLPLLLVCENNHLAGNVRPEHYLPVEHVAQRASGYGIESDYVDGNDLDSVLDAAESAIAYVRSKQRPFLLECDTTRLGRHKQGQGDIRSQQEKDLLALRDPLMRIEFPEGLRESLQAEIDAIIEGVLASPDPSL